MGLGGSRPGPDPRSQGPAEVAAATLGKGPRAPACASSRGALPRRGDSEAGPAARAGAAREPPT